MNMADIELVIKIPEEEYKKISNSNPSYANDFNLYYAIKNGTPIPKGHGRLIDADALVKKMEEREEKLKDDRSMWETATIETALDMYAQTIIEADKTEVMNNTD